MSPIDIYGGNNLNDSGTPQSSKENIKNYRDNYYYGSLINLNETDIDQMEDVSDSCIYDSANVPTSFSRPFSHLFPIDSNTVKKSYVSEINWSMMEQRRGGVIPYCYHNGIRYFNLGVDRNYLQLTDFAGGINFRHDKDVLKGSLREFSEESLRVYGHIPQDCLDRSLAIYNYEMIIIFVDVTQIIEGHSMEEIQEIFENKSHTKYHKKHKEIKSIVWIPEDKLKWMIDHPKDKVRHINHPMIKKQKQENNGSKDSSSMEIYSVVRNCLHRAGDFYTMLN